MRSFFYTIYAAPDILELFKTAQEQTAKKEAAKKAAAAEREAKIRCPSCGVLFDKRITDTCPECNLALSEHENTELVERYKKRNDEQVLQLLNNIKTNRRKKDEKENSGKTA
ncbi:MAG: hypothetical protein Ta2A_07800 [Treponemataceae bacterium]|nr:MAG: hypothetical protein Ta2A_07800 [Treponemataceae bacterium]